jgi:predicted nucleic acid-binding protein
LGLSGSTVFLDSCIAIYLVEEHEKFSSQIESLIESANNAELVVSDLSVMECLVGPLRASNVLLEEKYKNWFDNILVVPLPGIVFREAARLRADHPSLKPPDALHLATAVHYNCDELWTNDDRLSKVAGIVKRIV